MYQVVTATVDLTAKGRRVHAWNLAENAGSPAAARVLLRDGGASGAIVADIRLPASDSKHAAYGTRGLTFTAGVYVEVATGTVRGSVDID